MKDYFQTQRSIEHFYSGKKKPRNLEMKEALYTLIRRLKPIIEQHSDLKIEADRGKAYELKMK